METIALDFPAARAAQGRALAGVVASGDLEVLVEGSADARTSVNVTTSVDGMGHLWRAVLDRMLADGVRPAVKIEINDFGATPGVVQMRILQAFEALERSHS